MSHLSPSLFQGNHSRQILSTQLVWMDKKGASSNPIKFARVLEKINTQLEASEDKALKDSVSRVLEPRAQKMADKIARLNTVQKFFYSIREWLAGISYNKAYTKFKQNLHSGEEERRDDEPSQSSDTATPLLSSTPAPDDAAPRPFLLSEARELRVESPPLPVEAPSQNLPAEDLPTPLVRSPRRIVLSEATLLKYEPQQPLAQRAPLRPVEALFREHNHSAEWVQAVEVFGREGFKAKIDYLEPKLASTREKAAETRRQLKSTDELAEMERLASRESARSPAMRAWNAAKAHNSRLEQEITRYEGQAAHMEACLGLIVEEERLFERLVEAYRLSLKAGVMQGREQDRLSAKLYSLLAKSFTFSAIGELNSGKSTFLASFVGQEVSPTDEKAMTTLPTRLTHRSDFTEPRISLEGCAPLLNEELDRMRAHLEAIGWSQLSEEEKNQLFRPGFVDVQFVDFIAARSFHFQSFYQGKEDLNRCLRSLHALARLQERELWTDSRQAYEGASLLDQIHSLDQMPHIEACFACFGANPFYEAVTFIDTPGVGEASLQKLHRLASLATQYSDRVFLVVNPNTIATTATDRLLDQLKKRTSNPKASRRQLSCHPH